MRCQQCAKYELIIQRMGHELNEYKILALQQHDFEQNRQGYLDHIASLEKKVKKLKERLNTTGKENQP